VITEAMLFALLQAFERCDPDLLPPRHRLVLVVLATLADARARIRLDEETVAVALSCVNPTLTYHRTKVRQVRQVRQVRPAARVRLFWPPTGPLRQPASSLPAR